MDYPIQSPGQLSSHLRALRKARGLSQAQLGALLGVGQARVARIEHDPTAVGVEQFLGILNALEVQMVLRAGGAGKRLAAATAGSAARAGRPPADEPW
jgi:HTH-type transcriptional regulator/antitoxin HipB